MGQPVPKCKICANYKQSIAKAMILELLKEGLRHLSEQRFLLSEGMAYFYYVLIILVSRINVL